MDDTLELPTAAATAEASQDREDEEQSSGDEDQGPDWTKIPGLSAARPVIPKRGEKDFEPTAQGGSGLQRHVLDRSRLAMLEALKATRSISYKSVSHAIWYPQLSRAHVTVARGIHFATMGHSVARLSDIPEDAKKTQKRLELLPEEALYLVERGAMYCWKPADSELPLYKTPHLDDMQGIPMSVQQVYAEMIGTENLTMERYQVYAYLRRLGYVVTRAKPPSSDYPAAPPFPPAVRSSVSIFGRLYSAAISLVSRLASLFVGGLDWWRPIPFGRWVHGNSNNKLLFRSLRFLPSGHSVPLRARHDTRSSDSPYQIFFHLYKPSTPFKKTAPPLPDFSIVVVNARTTPMPTIYELTDLFGELPELPPPVPRKRMSFAQQKQAAASASQQTNPNKANLPASQSSPAQKWFAASWMWPWSQSSNPENRAKATPRPPNPFPSLKQGKKIVIIATVDAGTISFFRFGEGVFAEWPMV